MLLKYLPPPNKTSSPQLKLSPIRFLEPYYRDNIPQSNGLDGVLVKLPIYSGNYITLKPQEEIDIEATSAEEIAFYREVSRSFSDAKYYPILKCEEGDEPEPSTKIVLPIQGETPLETHIETGSDSYIAACYIYDKTLGFDVTKASYFASAYITPEYVPEFGTDVLTNKLSLMESPAISGLIAAPFGLTPTSDPFCYLFDCCNIVDGQLAYDQDHCVIGVADSAAPVFGDAVTKFEVEYIEKPENLPLILNSDDFYESPKAVYHDNFVYSDKDNEIGLRNNSYYKLTLKTHSGDFDTVSMSYSQGAGIVQLSFSNISNIPNIPYVISHSLHEVALIDGAHFNEETGNIEFDGGFGVSLNLGDNVYQELFGELTGIVLDKITPNFQIKTTASGNQVYHNYNVIGNLDESVNFELNDLYAAIIESPVIPYPITVENLEVTEESTGGNSYMSIINTDPPLQFNVFDKLYLTLDDEGELVYTSNSNSTAYAFNEIVESGSVTPVTISFIKQTSSNK